MNFTNYFPNNFMNKKNFILLEDQMVLVIVRTIAPTNM